MTDIDEATPNIFDPAYTEAAEAIERQDYETALACTDDLETRLPGEPAVLDIRARACLELGRHEEARAAWERVIAATEARIAARPPEPAAEPAGEADAERAALAEFDRLCAWQTVDRAHLGIATAWERQGDHARALAALESALQQRQESVFLRAYFAVLHFQDGRRQEAVEACLPCAAYPHGAALDDDWGTLVSVYQSLGLAEAKQAVERMLEAAAG